MLNIFHRSSLCSDWLDARRPYLFFGHGTGDTFNACLALKSLRLQSNQQADAIIPAYQLPLVHFLCDCLGLPIRNLHCLDFFDHSHVNALAQRHPEFKFTFGFPPPVTAPGVHICWTEPSVYPQRFRLDESDLVSFRSNVCTSAFGNVSRPDQSTAVLFTSMSQSIRLPESFWQLLTAGLRRRGFKVLVNTSGNSNYGREAVGDVSALTLTHPELMHLVYANPSLVTLIGLRSGIFDILRLADSQSIVFYPSTPAWMWGACRLHRVGYSRLRAQEVLLPPRFEVDEDYFRALLDSLVV